MISIRSQFNKDIKSIAKENGFQKYKAPYMSEIYFRATDELLQVFNLEVYPSGGICDICFSSHPIRGKITDYHFRCAQYPLGLADLAKSPGRFFEYDRRNEESIVLCSKNCVELFKKHTLNFFNSATTCDSALKALFDMEYAMYKTFSYLRTDKLYMALNTKNTEVALKCCHAWIEHYEPNLDRKDMSQDDLMEIKLEKEKYEKYVQMLEEKNYDFFEEVLDSLEENSRTMIDRILATKRKK